MGSHPTVFAVGTANEIAHHVAPLAPWFKPVICPPEEVVFRAQPGDLAIFYSEHFDRFREAIQRLSAQGIATLYLIDGILEWRNAWENEPNEVACPWTMRPVLAHKVACLGHSQARLLAAWGNADQVEIVGAPRLDALLHGNLPTSETRSGDVWRLLIATAKSPGFTASQFETTYRSLQALRDWLSAHPQIAGRRLDIIWRLTGGLAERLGVPNQLSDLTGGELQRQLLRCDAVITTPSTTLLEGMAMRKPVALLDFHPSPSWCPAAWTMSSTEHFGPVLAELATPPPVKLMHQQWLFRDALYQAEPAAPRLARLVERMLELAAAQIRQHQALTFPARLLAPPKPIEDTWDFAALYPQHADFSRDDKTALQRDLAHARREIDRLRERVAQLQSELGEAHQIFEAIHRHPVAGPVVRLRQRWLDWLATWSPPSDPTAGPSTEAKR